MVMGYRFQRWKGGHQMNLIHKITLPKQATGLLLLLLSADVFYIILHLISKAARFFDLGSTIRKETFMLTKDLGLAESFQYVKEFWNVLLLAWLIYKNRNLNLLGWVLLYAFLLSDDMFSFHEGLAGSALGLLGLSAERILFLDVRYQDLGELGVALLFGLIFLTPIGVAYLRGNPETRRTFHTLTGCLLLLLLFGIVGDFFDRFFPPDIYKFMFELSDILEDGGEMVAMSITCWYVYTLAGPPTASA